HRDLGVVELVVGIAGEELGDQHLRAVVLDIGLVDRVVLHLPGAGRIEDLLLDDRVDAELGADLLDQRLLALGAARLLDFLEEVLDLSMVRLQERDRVRFLLCHEVPPLFERQPLPWLLFARTPAFCRESFAGFAGAGSRQSFASGPSGPNTGSARGLFVRPIARRAAVGSTSRGRGSSYLPPGG